MEMNYCKASVAALNNLLADQFVLMTKVLNFHWNIVGPTFMSDHKFLETIYRESFENADDIAERIRIVGGRPLASLHGYLSHNRIKEYSEEKEVATPAEVYSILTADYDQLISEIMSDVDNLEKSQCTDLGTLSYLEDYATRLQKTAWTIRMHTL